MAAMHVTIHANAVFSGNLYRYLGRADRPLPGRRHRFQHEGGPAGPPSPAQCSGLLDDELVAGLLAVLGLSVLGLGNDRVAGGGEGSVIPVLGARGVRRDQPVVVPGALL
jgi:hypothetical protein